MYIAPAPPLLIKIAPDYNEQELEYNTDNEISARNYLNPYTMTRPDLSEIIPNYVLEFSLMT